MSYWRYKYKQDVIIATLIVILPFFGYLHLMFSDKNSVITFFDFHLEHWFNTNEVFIWMILSDFLPLLLLLIMFFTSKPSWKYFLMPLLSLYLLGIFHTLDYFTNSYYYIVSIEGISTIILFSAIILLMDSFIFKSYRDKIIELKIKALLLNKLKLDHEQVDYKIRSIRSEKTKISIIHYLKKIYYLKIILRNTLENNSTNPTEANKKSKRKIDLVIVLILISITILWFVDSQIPRGSLEMEFFGIKISNNGFNDVHTFIWIASRKLIVMVFLSLWLTTCQYWWKFAILSPLLLFTYQFWEVFQNVRDMDAIGNSKVFPLVFLTVIFITIASRLVKYQTNLLEFHESLNNEIDHIIEELKHEKIVESKRIYNSLKEQFSPKNNEEILTRLIEIQDKLLRNLE